MKTILSRFIIMIMGVVFGSCWLHAVQNYSNWHLLHFIMQATTCLLQLGLVCIVVFCFSASFFSAAPHFFETASREYNQRSHWDSVVYSIVENEEKLFRLLHEGTTENSDQRALVDTVTRVYFIVLSLLNYLLLFWFYCWCYYIIYIYQFFIFWEKVFLWDFGLVTDSIFYTYFP